jgi:HD-GYP domain-containing protein (c-di-GMP phosphodiesterase class II)
MIYFDSILESQVRQELQQRNLKLKNQIAQLDNLLRKKESLEIEINRLRKTIKLSRKNTHRTVQEQLSGADISFRMEEQDIILNEEVGVSAELLELFQEFNQLETDYLKLESLFADKPNEDTA